MQIYLQNEYIYEKATEGVKIKSKCQWYESVHNQLKKQSIKVLVTKLDENEKTKVKSNYEIKVFLEELFNCHRVNW